jgi:CheY-like chemotaxis protein
VDRPLERHLLDGGIRAIAVSGYGTQQDIERSLAVGFDEHLVKPFSARKLRDAISRIMAQRSSGEQKVRQRELSGREGG